MLMKERKKNTTWDILKSRAKALGGQIGAGEVIWLTYEKLSMTV